jgi:putative redox protein
VDATTTVRWLTGQQYVGIDSTNHSIVLSTKAENVGVKPSDVMLIALAACTAVDMVDILAKKRMPIDSLEIITTGQQDEDPPWTFRRINLKYRLSGEALNDKAVAQAIDLAEEKYCSVAATLRGVAEITTEFEIIS